MEIDDEREVWLQGLKPLLSRGITAGLMPRPSARAIFGVDCRD